MTIKYTKWPSNRPNGNKIDQMTLHKTFSIERSFYPNWYFWFQNKRSGNPATVEGEEWETRWELKAAED
jgi:hypothetical protein